MRREGRLSSWPQLSGLSKDTACSCSTQGHRKLRSTNVICRGVNELTHLRAAADSVALIKASLPRTQFKTVSPANRSLQKRRAGWGWSCPPAFVPALVLVYLCLLGAWFCSPSKVTEWSGHILLSLNQIWTKAEYVKEASSATAFILSGTAWHPFQELHDSSRCSCVQRRAFCKQEEAKGMGTDWWVIAWNSLP